MNGLITNIFLFYLIFKCNLATKVLIPTVRGYSNTQISYWSVFTAAGQSLFGGMVLGPTINCGKDLFPMTFSLQCSESGQAREQKGLPAWNVSKIGL